MSRSFTQNDLRGAAKVGWGGIYDLGGSTFGKVGVKLEGAIPLFGIGSMKGLIGEVR
jgi:hypothetical protein